MTKSSTNLRLTVLSMVAIIMLGLLVLAIVNIRAESQETLRLLTLSSEAAKKETLAQAIKDLQSRAGEEIEAFEILTLSDDRLVSLIESIEGAGRALNLTLEIVSVEKKGGEDPKAPQTINLEIKALGSWNSTFSLLKGLESLPHRVMIERASLRKVETFWQADVVLSLHSFN